MKREILEQFLGKKVEITLFDKSMYKGILRREFNEYIPSSKHYHIREEFVCFRCSHVIKVKEVKE